MDSCDVLIVGGGQRVRPARGNCAEAGLDTVILDKSTFPRRQDVRGLDHARCWTISKSIATTMQPVVSCNPSPDFERAIWAGKKWKRTMGSLSATEFGVLNSTIIF